MRLYLRDNLLKWEEDLIKLMESLLKLAEDHRDTIMPGYSHRQIATISSFAHLILNYYQSFDRDLKRFGLAYDFLDACPLGAAAGFGTTWPIERQSVARYMGFKRVDENALDCVSSRSEIEGQVAECLTFFLIHASRIAQDFIYLSAPEVKMLVLPDNLVTGSSIMPQKRNPDGLEIIIGKASVVQGLYNSLLGLSTGKRSGYNREYQWGKYMVMDAFRESAGVAGWLADCVHHLQINRDVMYRTASSGFINAVDVADGLARIARISFRDAYKITATAVAYSSDEGELTLDALTRSMEEKGVSYKITPGVFVKMIDPRKNLNARKAIGGPAPEEVTRQIHQNSQKLLERRIKLHERQKQIEQAWEYTWSKLEP
jgi:argininosuccinate lyase